MEKNADVLGLIKGDKDCFLNIYRKFKDKVFYYTLKITRSDSIAEEIVQEVFVKLWTKREQINPDFPFSSYLFRITHNHTINILKRNTFEEKVKKNLYAKSRTSHSTTEDQVIYNDYLKILNDAIDQLPPKRKDIFDLSRLQGVSHDDIATQMGISKNTVKSQIVKANKTIKEYIQVNAGISC